VASLSWRNPRNVSRAQCVLALNTGARAARARPALGFRATSHGSTGRLRWFVGPTRLAGFGPATVAEAFSPTPAGFAAAAERSTVFELTLTVSPTSATCRQAQRSVSLTR
jgi:hypothetical protein